MYIMVAHIIFLIFRSTQPKWVDSLAQHTLVLMKTTLMKYNLVFINLTWLLSVQMDTIILRGSHSLKIWNAVFLEVKPPFTYKLILQVSQDFITLYIQIHNDVMWD